jgi:CBS domain-containing membrane protein
VLTPVLSGVLLLLLVALLFNNLSPTRHYPANKHWYRFWQRKYQNPARPD